jgi:hypothetical protein
LIGRFFVRGREFFAKKRQKTQEAVLRGKIVPCALRVLFLNSPCLYKETPNAQKAKSRPKKTEGENKKQHSLRWQRWSLFCPPPTSLLLFWVLGIYGLSALGPRPLGQRLHLHLPHFRFFGGWVDPPLS